MLILFTFMVIIVKISLPLYQQRDFEDSVEVLHHLGGHVTSQGPIRTPCESRSLLLRAILDMQRCFTIQIVLSGKPEASFLSGTFIFPLNSEEFTPQKNTL